MDLGLLQQAVRNRHVLVGPHALTEAAADHKYAAKWSADFKQRVP